MLFRWQNQLNVISKTPNVIKLASIFFDLISLFVTFAPIIFIC